MDNDHWKLVWGQFRKIGNAADLTVSVIAFLIVVREIEEKGAGSEMYLRIPTMGKIKTQVENFPFSPHRKCRQVYTALESWKRDSWRSLVILINVKFNLHGGSFCIISQVFT